jgi:hypothetical protein
LNNHRFSSALGALALAILAALSCALCVSQSQAQVNVLTNRNDISRDGLNSNEVLLSSSTVNSNQFGKLFAFNVDGYAQAQPLYMSALTVNGATHNVAFVATMHDSVFAIDADTGVQLWQTSLLYPSGATTVPMSAQGCGGVTGFDEVGILGTPVIDPSTNTLYVVAKTDVSGTYYFYLHALDVTTGLEKFGGPTSITATIGSLTFNVLDELQRPGLLESNGSIYIGFGSNGCDITGRGWFFAYNASTLQQEAVMTTQPDNSYGSSIWQGGTGPAADSLGNIYFATANGQFDYGTSDLGDSVLQLTLGSGGFTLADYFTPFDQANMYDNDLDLGSCGPVLLPTQTNSSTPNLILTSGKDEDIYLLNQNSMGGYNTANNDQIVQYIPATLLGELHGSPLFWNNYAYFLAQQDYLRAYQLSTNSSTGVTSLTTTPVVETSSKLTTQGFPSISANGNTNGIVWVVRNVKSVPKLSAYDATALLLLYDSGQAAGGRDTLGIIGHGAVPTIANGKVYAGTQTQLVVYGLFNDIAATAGGGQTGSAGTTLPTALTVLASNPYTGQPISGVSVAFSDGGAGGTFGSPTVITGSNGQASTSYTLPKTPANITITATSTGFASASFVETGVVGPVATIATISGSKQTGPVGTTLPKPIVVKAKDAFGNLEVGAQISFSDGYGGIFSPNPGVTGTNGEASVTYTLPTVAKSLTVSATNGSVTDKITEAATADPPALVNIIQGNNQTARVKNKLPKTLIVSVTDQYGNGLSGLTVNFTDNGAGGSFSNPNPVTSTTGQVTVTYTTGPNEGTVTIDATYSTLAPAVFTETVD